MMVTQSRDNRRCPCHPAAPKLPFDDSPATAETSVNGSGIHYGCWRWWILCRTACPTHLHMHKQTRVQKNNTGVPAAGRQMNFHVFYCIMVHVRH
jgi:hypothetical protein